MRILYVCGAGIFSGLEKMTLQLMMQARGAGHEVLCLTSFWGNGEFVSRLEAEGISFERTWLGFLSMRPRWAPVIWTLDQIRRLPQLWWDFRRVVKEWKPDIIHHTNFHHVSLLACLPGRSEAPNIYHVHNAIVPSEIRRQIYKVIDRYVDRFIAVSSFVKRNLLGHGLDGNKIGVILNGVPPPNLKAGKGRLWRQGYGWTEEDVIVGIAGQIGPWKGHEDFIRGIALAQQKDPRVKGVVIGRGSEEYLNYLKRLVGDCLPNSMVFAGYFSDMDLAYKELDILAVPSRFEEPFSLSAAEGMSYGLPVIGTFRGAIPEVMGDDLKECLVPPENPSALAEKIVFLAQDPLARQEVGKKARQRAIQHLSLERCSNQMMKEYELALV